MLREDTDVQYYRRINSSKQLGYKYETYQQTRSCLLQIVYVWYNKYTDYLFCFVVVILIFVVHGCDIFTYVPQDCFNETIARLS